MDIVIFSNFDKRNNSTKIPDDRNGVTAHAHLKDSTSVINPRFIVVRTSVVGYDINYVHALGRYYNVEDCIIHGNEQIEIICKEDPLATIRKDIFNTRCSITYAADSRKNIVDSRIPLMSEIDVSESTAAINNLLITGYDNMGSVILGITGWGSFGTYLMKNSTQVKELMDGIDIWTSSKISDVASGFQQLFMSGFAPDNLKSAIALPLAFSAEDIGGEEEDIYLGFYPCKDNGQPIRGYHITKPIISRVTNISIPWKYNDWRRNQPYSEVVLYMPFIGIQSIPTNEIINESSLTIEYSINVTSGDIATLVRAGGSGRILSTSNGNIAMATAYGSSGINTTKMTSSVMSGAVSIASIATSSGASVASIGGAIGSVAKGTLDAIGGNSGGSGGLGGGATQGLDRVIHCYVVSRRLTDEQSSFDAIMGRPYMAVSTPGQHSGFIATDGFSVNSYAEEPIREYVNAAMDSGVFIE